MASTRLDPIPPAAQAPTRRPGPSGAPEKQLDLHQPSSPSASRAGRPASSASTNGTHAPAPKPKRSALRMILSRLLEQWNLFLMGLLVFFAYLWPYVGTTHGAVRAEYTVSWGAVGLIFLIAGLTLSPKALLKGIPHWRAHIVQNVLSFLFAPAIMFAFATAGKRAALDFYVLAGLIVTGTTPTGIAANVSCTLNAKGSTELASIEVVIGNVLGTFITPLLAEMFLSSPVWVDAAPGSHGSVTAIYIRMAKQLSATLFAPLIVGLVLQISFPRPVARIRTALRLNKIATVFTTLCVWHNFCKAFYSGVFKTTSTATVIYICFMGCAAYFLFMGSAFLTARLPGLDTPWARWWRFSKRDTIALCFCTAAKGVALGAPLVTILFADVPIEAQAKLTLSLLIYNGEHIALNQLVIPVLRWWARDEIEQEELRPLEEQGLARDARQGTTGSSKDTPPTGTGTPTQTQTQHGDEEQAVGLPLPMLMPMPRAGVNGVADGERRSEGEKGGTALHSRPVLSVP